jgi:hypothetical protein
VLVLALALTLVLLVVRRAGGEELSSGQAEDARRAEARKHFERGLVLSRTGQNWNDALAEFLRSRELFPTRSATRNVAIALRHLDRHVEAVDYYTRLLREFSDSMSPEDVAAISAEMSVTRRNIAQLEIRCNEPGATVLVDGEARGTTPLSGPLQLNAGPHLIRVMKPGFEPWELEIKGIGGSRDVRDARLRAVVRAGTLVVEEANGLRLDVLVDSIVVGQTPWRGSVSEGTHQVILRGPEHTGTPPSSADVRVGRTTTLTLRSVPLQASLRVEPIPSNASVFINGVSVGNGVWRGRLPKGSHRLEVVAPGHLPLRRQVQADGDSPVTVRASLERDLTSPMWRPRFRQAPYVELTAGALLSPSLRGGADQGCGCTERNRPSGVIAMLRPGYTVARGLGVELSAGFLWLSESMTRNIAFPSVEGTGLVTSSDYRDETTLFGPLGALGASYRMLHKTPVTARLSAGLAFLTSRSSNSGTFAGRTRDGSEPFISRTSVPEVDQSLLTPFLSLDLRAGYRFSPLISADFGVALMVFLPPRVGRTGATSFSGDGARATQLNPNDSEGNALPSSNLTLPREDVADTFLAVAPAFGVRVAF